MTEGAGSRFEDDSEGLSVSSLENVGASRNLRKSAPPGSAGKKVRDDLEPHSLLDGAGHIDHTPARLHTHRNGADASGVDEHDRASFPLPHQTLPHHPSPLPRRRRLLLLRDNHGYVDLVLTLDPLLEDLILRPKDEYFDAHLADGSGTPSLTNVAEMSPLHPF